MPIEGDGAEHRAAHAGKRLEELALAVAGDAGDADDLARMDREGRVRDAQHAAGVDHGEILDLEHRRAGRALALLDLQQHAPADHRLGELRRRGLGGHEGGDHLAPAHHRDPVGDRHDLAQLVGDQDDRLALRLQRPQQLEQGIGLGRGQHRGRLVEDEDVGAAIEGLQDLDALLQADRQVADGRVDVDIEAVIARETGELGAHLGVAGAQERAALGAEHDVLDHA